ncbi:MAG: PepSY domain-containing protein [Victivallaceae bacterium]|nr:PepSY domain-containing protein [Victivallaceae bacterium]
MKTKLIALLTTLILILTINSKGSDGKMCKINIELVPNVLYKPHRIPVKVTFTNNQDKPIRLLKLTDKNGRYLHALSFGCYDKQGRAQTGSGFTPKNPPKDDLLEYISLNPKEFWGVEIDISKLLRPRPEPGEYRLELRYHNLYGDKCVKGLIKAENTLTIALAEPDNKLKLGYISKEEAVAIAKKAYSMQYDKNQSLKISLDEGIYTVVFPVDIPKDTWGPSYAAKVKIDAETGKVLQVLGG